MKYENIRMQFINGDLKLEMGKDSLLKIIGKPEGLEGIDEYEVKTEERNQYDGANVLYKRVPARPISFDFGCPRVDKAFELREQVIRFFNPKESGRLIVTYFDSIKYIDYEVISVKDQQEGLWHQLKFHVELTCPESYFQEIYEDSTTIETWIGGWEWKFSLPFHLRLRGPQRLTIHNDGHVPTPIQVEFPGPAYYPQVINNTTGEFIKVRTSLGPYDVLYIDTTFGKKSVEISREGGERENAFDLIDLDSVFFELGIGDNDIEFKCDDADTVPQAVKINYRNRYLGV